MNRLRHLKEYYRFDKLPTVSKKIVFHIGTMDIKNKGQYSYEGSGLSISTNPNEWKKIHNRLSGDLIRLTKDNSLFLDYYSLDDSQKKDIIQYGVDNGYIERTTTYRHTYYDEEMESEVYSEFETLAEAEYEAGEDGEIEERTDSIKPTIKLTNKLHQGKIDISNTFSMLTIAYIEDTTNFDGIWWEEELDVLKYSAPRGVIFNHKIVEWKVENLGGY